MTEYVVGFMFDEMYRRVVLIIKNRPEWQKGLLNGVGGHIEKGETPVRAMRREFFEETGVRHPDWDDFLTLTSHPSIPDEESWRVYFFQTVGDVRKAKTTTDEHVGIYDPQHLPHNAVPNLKWLIPLAALNEVTGSLYQRREHNA